TLSEIRLAAWIFRNNFPYSSGRAAVALGQDPADHRHARFAQRVIGVAREHYLQISRCGNDRKAFANKCPAFLSRQCVIKVNTQRRCHMYATVRWYEGATDPKETGRRVNEGFYRLLARSQDSSPCTWWTPGGWCDDFNERLSRSIRR